MDFQRRPLLEIPSLPDDLGDLSDSTLMTLFTQLTQWANYANVQVAKADIEEDEAEAALAVESAKYVIRSMSEEKITMARLLRDADTEIAELSAKVRQAKAFRKMVTTLFNNTERSANLVSRELSRRIGLAPGQGRSNRTGA